MKFTKQEYIILHSALNKIYKEDHNYAINKLAQFFTSLKNEHETKQTKLIPSNNDLVEIIKNQRYDNLREIDFNITNEPVENTNFRRYRVNCGFMSWFNFLDKKELSILQKEFEAHNINLALELQKDILVFSKQNKPYYNKSNDLGKEYIELSKMYINSLTIGEQQCNTETEKAIFDSLVYSSIYIFNKESHKTTLKLIRIAIEQKFPQDKVLSLFKEFIDHNKTINVQAKKDLEFIKETIKDWDISKYFSLAEKKMLYSKSDGITAKRVSGLYYDLDINFIKAKNKTTSALISHNLRVLVGVIPVVLGNLPDYVGITQVLQEPLIQINILFEKDVKEHQIEVMNAIMEEVLASKVQIEEVQLLNKIKTTLLAVFLEDNLTDKSNTEVNAQRKKI